MTKKLLDSATNMFGPIGAEARAQIVRYLDAPSADGWDDIHGIVIEAKRFRTIWQAVTALDPSFRNISIPYSSSRGRRSPPSKRWKRWPDALLVMRAIKAALSGAPPPGGHGRFSGPRGGAA